MLRSPRMGQSEAETLRSLDDLAGRVHVALARQWRGTQQAAAETKQPDA
jgi:hypothetical protein